VRCAPDGDRRGEEPGFLDRTIRLGTGGDYSLTVTARPVAGNPLLGLVQDGLLVAAQASSSAVTDPRGSAFAAIDGDGGTSWIADPADPAPTLGVRWLGERRISGIRLGLDPQAAAAPARRVRLEFPGGSRVVELDDRGRGQFVPFTSSRLDVVVLGTRWAVSLGPDGSTTRLGAGVSELRLRGTGLLPAPALSDVPVDVGCSFGPTVRVGSDFYPTSVVASPRQLAAGEDVPARLCGPEEVRLGSGSTRLVLGPAPAFRPIGAVLRRSDLPAQDPVLGTAGPVDVSWTDTVSRHVSFGAAATERVLNLPENANPGWEAAVPDGAEIEPVIVDGWQQGWRVPADVSRLTVSFAPDGLYRAALLGGAALLAMLLLLSLGPAVAGVLGHRRRSPLQDEPPAVSTRRLPRTVVVAVGALALGLVAGWEGLLIAVGVGVALTPRTVRERLPEPLLVIACSVPLAAAIGVAVLRPWGSDEGWAGVLVVPQLLALVTVAAVVAREPTRPGPTFLSRRAGRSTSR
jgi:arabinofuranan 3-O-arabinosyltransferase